MARPRKTETDDRYNEESLNLQEAGSRRRERNPDSDDVPELGERRSSSFDRLNDAALFGGGGY